MEMAVFHLVPWMDFATEQMSESECLWALMMQTNYLLKSVTARDPEKMAPPCSV